MAERAFAAHAAWFARGSRCLDPRVCAAAARPSISRSPAERANIDAALAWTAAHDPLLGLRIATGFGWAWVVLGDYGAHSASSPHSTRPATRATAGDRASALLLAGWIEASAGHLDVAREHIAAATDLADALDDVELQARCCYYLAYVVSHHGEFRAGDASSPIAARALYDGLDRPWDQAANGLFAAQGRDLGR